MKWIKLFEEFINEEIEESYLYHWVNNYKMEDIIKNDIIKSSFDNIINDKKYSGNSFTRNKNLSILHYHIKITFYKNKLSENNKIIPIDPNVVVKSLNSTKRSRDPKTSKIFGDSPINYKSFEKNKWDEEFIVGDIKNLHKKIKEIEIYDSIWKSNENDQDVINYCNKFNIPFKINKTNRYL